MSAQESLTFLFDAIALGFIVIATVDLSREIIALYNQIFVSSQQPILPTSQPQQLSLLPDPWLLPVVEIVSSAAQITQTQKPLLLLAQAKAMGEVQLAVSKQPLASSESLEALLSGVNLDKLQLRPARRIAKALGIAQKVNGRDQNLEFLRSQIKIKLQQSLLPDVELVVSQELIAC